jgi:hypothetical protein
MATLPIIRGDYEVIEFTIVEPDPDNAGETRARDITNDTFLFTAKRQLDEPEGLIVKSSEGGAGITKTAPTLGKGQIEILPEDTQNLSESLRLLCDLEGTAPPDRPYTSRFNLKVELDVTN